MELAERAGTSQASISRRENGLEAPTLDMLRHLAFTAGTEVAIQVKPMPKSERRDALIEHRGAILACLQRYGASQPRVFGSVARGDDSASSDIDLLVTLRDSDRSEVMVLLSLSEELSEIAGKQVDVSTERILLPDIRKSARRDAVPL